MKKILNFAVMKQWHGPNARSLSSIRYLVTDILAQPANKVYYFQKCAKNVNKESKSPDILKFLFKFQINDIIIYLHPLPRGS
jgi:hypothetical protein